MSPVSKLRQRLRVLTSERLLHSNTYALSAKRQWSRKISELLKLVVDYLKDTGLKFTSNVRFSGEFNVQFGHHDVEVLDFILEGDSSLGFTVRPIYQYSPILPPYVRLRGPEGDFTLSLIGVDGWPPPDSLRQFVWGYNDPDTGEIATLDLEGFMKILVVLLTPPETGA